MKPMIFSRIIRYLPVVCLITMIAPSCKKDTLVQEEGLFRPLFLSNRIVVNGNVIHYAWYGIKGAESYTFELSVDSFKTAPIRSFTVEESSLTVEGLDYEMTYQCRVKANAADGSASEWMPGPEQVIGKRVVALVLQPVDRMQLGDHTARVNWDTKYAVDSLTLERLPDGQPQVVAEIRLSSQEAAKGYYDFNDLEANAAYQVTISDSRKTAVIDRPYNAVSFKTSGAPDGAVVVPRYANLLQMLIDAEDDPAVPAGTTYYLPAGGVYYFASFEDGDTEFATPTGGKGMTFSKAFNLVGSSSGMRPKVYLTKDLEPEGTFSAGIRFEGIDFVGLLQVGTSSYKPYLLAFKKFTDVPEIQLVDCNMTNLVRGIISCKEKDNEAATVGKILIENCMITSGAADGYGILHGNKETNNFLKDVTIRNCTFANLGKGKGLVANVNKISDGVNITVSNCTFYNSQAADESFLDLEQASGSVIIENCVFASPFEDIMVRTGAMLTTSFNYATTDFAAAEYTINPILMTGVSAKDLFADPDGNDFTIKLKDSPVYLRQIGDPRWIR